MSTLFLSDRSRRGCDGLVGGICASGCASGGCDTFIGGTCGPAICADDSGCHLTHCGGPPCDVLTANPGLGEIVDGRSQEMIDAGCRPCALEMQGGATVTLTDSTGAVVDTMVMVE